MSFLMKKPNATPGFAIYRPNVNNSNNYFFQEGSFQAIEGNGTSTLSFEGGYRYFIEFDFASSHATSSAYSPTFAVYKYYGTGGQGEVLYSRAYSAGNDQKWLASIVIDATSDIYVVQASPYQSQSSTISIWRFPL